jgi:hypothetical protein
MLDKFWESIGSNLAEKWLQHIFGPAFLFWAGGFGLYLLRNGWKDTWESLSNLDGTQQAMLLFAGLFVLILSSLAMQQLRFTILRGLEGYWPSPLDRFAHWVAHRKNQRMTEIEQQVNDLKNIEEQAPLSAAEASRMAKLELRLHYTPADPIDTLPTALGNNLRSGETAPKHKYGLDSFACWPRLWLLLPEAARQDLSSARQSLMQFVELWAWGLLFLVWTIFSPWALLISPLWLLIAYLLALQAAMSYTDLIEAAFDLYRWELYKAAHWPLPEQSGEEEVRAGKALTEFLWRGTGGLVTYTQPKKE